MANPLFERWEKDHEKEHGWNACFEGFETAIKQTSQGLPEAYGKMPIIVKVELFGFFCDLIREVLKERNG